MWDGPVVIRATRRLGAVTAALVPGGQPYRGPEPRAITLDIGKSRRSRGSASQFRTAVSVALETASER
jgi:hypothetical protein